MKKRSIVIALVIAALLVLTLTGLALARTGVYWSGGSKVTVTYDSSIDRLTITWPEANGTFYGYLCNVKNPSGNTVFNGSFMKGNTLLANIDSVSAAGRWTITITAIESMSKLSPLDTLKKGCRVESTTDTTS